MRREERRLGTVENVANFPVLQCVRLVLLHPRVLKRLLDSVFETLKVSFEPRKTKISLKNYKDPYVPKTSSVNCENEKMRVL